MAYLRKEQKKYGTYISIVKAYRDENGNARQHRIANLGNIKNFSAQSLKNIGRSLYELGGGDPTDLQDPQIEEVARFNYGFYQVYKRILSVYGLDMLFSRLSRKHKLSYQISEVVLLMVIERLNEPASKRRNFLNQEEYLGLKSPIKLEHLYRTLDFLDQYSDVIQRQIYQKGRDLFNMELDVVFYDVTTLYFESQIEKQGDLRQKGFGKDGKIGDTQILFSMLIDKNQQPIGYEIYEGNRYEGHTLADALSRLKEKYQINSIVVVADRGMLSKSNLEQITDNGYEFIIGEKIKNLPKQIIKLITDKNQYQRFTEGKTDDEDALMYTHLEYGDRTIIGTYSKKRARKDKHDRDEKIRRAEKLLQTPSRIKSKATKHYLKSIGSNHYEIDFDKIKEQEKFDGFLAICTSSPTLSALQVVQQYAQLFKIEKTFRTFKHYLAIRPIFHWTNSRIKGHVCMAYISYTFLHHLLGKLQQNDIAVSEDQLRRVIGKMQLSLITLQNTELYMRSANDPLVPKICNTLKIRKIPNYIHPETLASYL